MFADKGQHFSPALLSPRFLSSQTWEVCLSLLLYRPLGREPTVLWGRPNLIFLSNEYWCYGPRLLAIRDIHWIWTLPDMSQFSQYSVRIFPAWYFQLNLITRVLLLKWHDFRDSRAPWEPHLQPPDFPHLPHNSSHNLLCFKGLRCIPLMTVVDV